MIKQTELLALAYKRYMQTKENRLNAENTFKKTYPEECYDAYRQKFEDLCSEMDNNETVQIFEDLKKSVKETEYKILIKETTDVILQQNLPEEKKHSWLDVFKYIEEKMVTSDTRTNTIADKKSKIKIIFDLANTQYIEDIDDYKAHEIKNKLFKLPRNAVNYSEKSINDLLDKDCSKLLSVDTINSYLICASQLYNVANEHDIKIKNPFKTLKIKKNKRTETRIYQKQIYAVSFF